jgi:transglutaminase-like putative cysteine protease
MNLLRLLLILLLISSLFLTDASGQPVRRQRNGYTLSPRQITIPDSTKVELDLSYDLLAPGETHKISLMVALPKTIPDRQKIISIKYSPTPLRIFSENGNSYAEFVFINPDKQTKVSISIKAELLRYDLNTARAKQEKDLSEGLSLEEFLKQERYIEKDDPKIQEIAQSIEGQTEVDTVKKIYNCVTDNMEYAIHGREEWGAVKALQQKKGDCTEYSDLFVAICRAKNIPARVATGYTVQSDTASSKHCWAEVYLQDYGWVPFDPSWGDVENPILRDRAFSRLRPIYIYLSYVRNDRLLRNCQFCVYRYWGDRAILKDSIEFKQITPSD